MLSAILKQWEPRFLFRVSMVRRKRNFLGAFHTKNCSLNKSKLSTVIQTQAWTLICYLDFSKVITKAAQGQQKERWCVWCSFSKNNDGQNLISENQISRSKSEFGANWTHLLSTLPNLSRCFEVTCSQAMITEVTFQNFNEKEKKKNFGFILPPQPIVWISHSYHQWFRYKPELALVVWTSLKS